MEWQNYVGAELHKSFAPLFNPTFNAEAKDQLRGFLRKKYEYVNSRLSGQAYLTGDRFTAADVYLFVTLRWAGVTNVDLSGLDALSAFMARVSERPAVKAALEAEGLTKKA
jgi:glutathione S-transferase